MATVEPYKMSWTAGEDRMLVVSIGTGTSLQRISILSRIR